MARPRGAPPELGCSLRGEELCAHLPMGGPDGTMHFFSAFTAGGAVCSLAVAWSMIHCTVPSSRRGKGFWWRRRWQPSVGFCTLCMVTAGYGFSWHKKAGSFQAWGSCVPSRSRRLRKVFLQPLLLSSSPRRCCTAPWTCSPESLVTVPSCSALRSCQDSTLALNSAASRKPFRRAEMPKGLSGLCSALGRPQQVCPVPYNTCISWPAAPEQRKCLMARPPQKKGSCSQDRHLRVSCPM